MKGKRPALGRGLGALLPTREAPGEPTRSAQPTPSDDAGQSGAPRIVAIEELAPNPDQPRRRFETEALDELANSIKTQGIIQPIVVTKAPHGEEAPYFIVAGERRWRAAQRAGLHEVPVVVRDIADEARLEVALVENIQRADLNPIEEARAYSELVRLRNYTQDDVAERVGKDRSTIANAMRLLRLPPVVQDYVEEGRLSMGHARALLGLSREEDMTTLAKEVARASMSVRATEAAVRKRVSAPKELDDEENRRQIIVGELELRLRRRLGVRVKLRPNRGKKGAGVVEIPYASLDELDRLLRVILHDEAQ